jgi:hypothetical protein
MTTFIKCQYKECNNITTDYNITYRAYCYKHNRLTLCNQSKANSIYLASSYPRVKTPTRRPLSPTRISPENAYKEIIKCMLCEKKKSVNDKMKCGHFICEDCIDCVKTMSCPACGENMEGPIINPKIKKMIEKRMFEKHLKEASNIFKINEDSDSELKL